MKTTHHIKTWPVFFGAVLSGAKTFEIRKDDRDYQRGDWLCLEEYDPETQAYTGAACMRRVTYCMRDLNFVKDGFVVMGLEER